MLLDAGRERLSKLAELSVCQKPALDESADLLQSDSRILLDLVQDLKCDFTASRSSRHHQVAFTPPGHAATASGPDFSGQFDNADNTPRRVEPKRGAHDADRFPDTMRQTGGFKLSAQ